MDSEKSLHRRKLKILWRIIYEQVNAWDPMGLLAAGAPASEYETEIWEIAHRIYRAPTDAQAVAEAMAAVFSRWFDATFTAGECLLAARRITEQVEKTETWA